MKRFSLYFLIIGVAALTCGCSSKKVSEETSTEQKADQKIVYLKEDAQKLIDLKTSEVIESPFESSIQVLGEIAQESDKTTHVTSQEPGVLRAFLREIGEIVEKETPLCEVMTKSGKVVQLVSPNHGIIVGRYLKEGDPVDNITSIMTVANTDVIRASFDVYEKDISRIKLGQKVRVKTISFLNKEFNGEIVFISPNVDDKTRAIRIRVNIDNKEDLLKFGMFVSAEIIESSSDLVLLVPKEAIVSLDDKPAVFVAASQGEFVANPVKIGREGKYVEIKEGLRKGDRIVVNGGFQLKSELLKSSSGGDEA